MEVQASENEILKGLKDQQACLIDGNTCIHVLGYMYLC